MFGEARRRRARVWLLILGLVGVGCSAGGDAAGPASTPPAAPATETDTPSDPSPSPAAATPPPTPRETAATQTAPPTAGGAAPPTDADIADFVADQGPADRTATGDIDADGAQDIAIVRTRDQTARLVVGFWDGSAFRTDADEGGPARAVDDLTIADLNGVGGAEVVTRQSVGEAGVSISVWSGNNGRLVRQEARGGCWDGFHTYGISGASIEPGRITATCDGSPLPPESWMSDVYEWSEGAWTYTETVSAEQE